MAENSTEAKQVFIHTFGLPMLRRLSRALEPNASELEGEAAEAVNAAILKVEKWMAGVTETPVIVPDDIMERIESIVPSLKKATPKKK